MLSKFSLSLNQEMMLRKSPFIRLALVETGFLGIARVDMVNLDRYWLNKMSCQEGKKSQ